MNKVWARHGIGVFAGYTAGSFFKSRNVNSLFFQGREIVTVKYNLKLASSKCQVVFLEMFQFEPTNGFSFKASKDTNLSTWQMRRLWLQDKVKDPESHSLKVEEPVTKSSISLKTPPATARGIWGMD